MAKKKPTAKGLIPFDLPLNEEQKELAASCERMVVNIAKKSANRNNNFDDLIDAGQMGLIRAAQTYDEAKGAFSTHAYRWILAKVLRARHELNKNNARKDYAFDVRNLPSRPAEDTWFDPDVVLQAFDSLPRQLQDVVRLRVWDDDAKKLDKVARRLGCVKQTVLTRQAKAFGILRDTLWRYAREAS
ncbi:MAG: sigma-70 family RNA polymerase sigma factor [Candidatus Pacebacteria bacterium]|nr:sigma-70 family RNA polymerase sigma factor [Candidatus Paceibacterota bacterium]